MPHNAIPDDDPLYRKYVGEVYRAGGIPVLYDQFCEFLRGCSDFDFSSLFLPPATVASTPAPLAPQSKVLLGRICITPAAAASIPSDEVCAALRRHGQGDWGDLCAHDRAENERALQQGGRLFSVYVASNQRPFWIITEADRSCTTLLLPEDY